MHMVASAADRMTAKIINRNHSTRKKLLWLMLLVL